MINLANAFNAALAKFVSVIAYESEFGREVTIRVTFFVDLKGLTAFDHNLKWKGFR